MKRVILSTFAIAVFTAGSQMANASAFKNCSEVNEVYPSGVAKSSAAGDKQQSKPFVSAKIYASIKKMDRDNDGTACEK